MQQFADAAQRAQEPRARWTDAARGDAAGHAALSSSQGVSNVPGGRTERQRAMRDLILTLIRKELGVPRHAEGAAGAAATKAFLAILKKVTSAGSHTEGDDAVISDTIASHLMQNRRQDARGLDQHLRFHGLRKRLLRHPRLRSSELRSAVFQLLYLLRGGSQEHLQDGNRGDVAVRGLESGVVGEQDSFRAFGDAGGSSDMDAATATLLMRDPQHQQQALGTELVTPRYAPQVGSVSEPQLIRDVLHALQGVESSCFRFDKAANCFRVQESVTLSRPAWQFVQQMLELASMHMRLSMASDKALEDGSGKSLLHQALCEALHDQLLDYYRVLALLMAKADSPDDPTGQMPELTLRRLWTWLLAPTQRMKLLLTLSEACAPLRGGALASAVHGFSCTGDTAAHDACVMVLQRVVKPLLAMIRAWMTEGELMDPFGEFFVCADSSAPLADLWTSMYSLEAEMVPKFLTMELARKIFLTGKSVNFIRLCCPGQDWSGAVGSKGPKVAGGPSGNLEGGRLLAMPHDPQGCDDIPLPGGELQTLGDWQLADLSARVEKAAFKTNRHLVSLLMGHYALGEHCLALRRFLLLSQGDFVESLMDNISSDLERDANEVYRHQLMGILDMAVRQSNAQYCSPDIIARLGIKLLASSSGEKAWDIFLLDYAIDSPLNVILTPAAMTAYDRAFAFLWKLRRVSHALASSWAQQMALQRHLVVCAQQLGTWAPELGLEMRQTLHKCNCLRNEMHHFIQNIHSYIMCEVLETSWAKLQTGWHACTDLDEVIREHQRYLSCIEEGAFLAPKTQSILTTLLALFAAVIDFTDLHDQVCTTAFEAVEVLLTEPTDAVPFAGSFAECRLQLDQLGAAFQVRLQSLLRALEVQPLLRHLSSDLRFLLCRLDFNNFYENKRAPPVGERTTRIG